MRRFLKNIRPDLRPGCCHLIEVGMAILMESKDLGEEVFALRLGGRIWVHVAENGAMRCIMRRKIPVAGRAKRR